jgi:hypothetical protein
MCAAKQKRFNELFAKPFIFIEADDGTQTRDLMITNQLLYQLSYIGILLFFNRKQKSYKNS